MLRNYLIRNSLFAGLLKQPKEGPPKSCWGYAVDLVKGKCSHPQNLDRELAALRTIAHTEITVRRKLNTTRRRTSNELMGCCCTVRFDNIPYKASAHICNICVQSGPGARSSQGALRTKAHPEFTARRTSKLHECMNRTASRTSGCMELRAPGIATTTHQGWSSRRRQRGAPP